MPNTILITREHHDSTVGGLHDLKGLLIDLNAKAIDAKLKTDILIERCLAVAPVSPMVPLKSPSSSGLGIPKMLFALTLCLATGNAGANSVREVAGMAAVKKENAGPLLDGGLKAMLAKDWETACGLFLRAYNKADADADASLGRAAECYYYLGRADEALGACNNLETATCGKSSIPPYIRGLVALAKKDYPTARSEFKLATDAGHECGEAMLRRVPK